MIIFGSLCQFYVNLAHMGSKKRAKACLGYRSFDTAERTLQVIEAVNMISKGRVKRLDKVPE